MAERAEKPVRPPRPPRKYVRRPKKEEWAKKTSDGDNQSVGTTIRHLAIKSEKESGGGEEIKSGAIAPEFFPEKDKEDFLVAVAGKIRPEEAKPEAETLEKELTPAEESGLKVLIKWQAPEYRERAYARERTILAGIILAGFFIGSLIIKNYLLAVIILLVYAVIYISSVRKPLMVDFAVTTAGIKIGSRLYEYHDLNSFWIFYEPPHHKELSLESKKVMMPFIMIPLTDVRPAELRMHLKKYLPEKKHEEALADILARGAGF